MALGVPVGSLPQATVDDLTSTDGWYLFNADGSVKDQFVSLEVFLAYLAAEGIGTGGGTPGEPGAVDLGWSLSTNTVTNTGGTPATIPFAAAEVPGATIGNAGLFSATDMREWTKIPFDMPANFAFGTDSLPRRDRTYYYTGQANVTNRPSSNFGLVNVMWRAADDRQIILWTDMGANTTGAQYVMVRNSNGWQPWRPFNPDGPTIVSLINAALGSSAWQAGGEGGGDVSISGSPEAGQIATWTSGAAIGGILIGTTAGTVASGGDSRFTNSREWTAATVSQSEAEAGTSATRAAWTAQRVRQAIAAWWTTVSSTKADTVHTHAQATTSTAGFLGASDKGRLDKAVVSDVTGITGATAVTNMVTLTASAYAALGTKNATTIYNVIADP